MLNEVVGLRFRRFRLNSQMKKVILFFFSASYKKETTQSRKGIHVNLVSPANSRLWERARAERERERDQNYGIRSIWQGKPEKKRDIAGEKRREKFIKL